METAENLKLEPERESQGDFTEYMRMEPRMCRELLLTAESQPGQSHQVQTTASRLRAAAGRHHSELHELGGRATWRQETAITAVLSQCLTTLYLVP